MEKTAKQIEKDLFHLVRNSELNKSIEGKVYRDGMRPNNSTREDVVVKFFSGLDGQEQNGVLLIHIYVPDIKVSKGTDLVENIIRIDELESMVNVFLKTLEDNTEYLFEKDGTPKSFPVEGIKQHFINVRIRYRRKTF